MVTAPEPEIPVRFVQLWLCDLCLDGKGGECHVPGCALWINRAPDISLRGNAMVTILDAEPQASSARDELEASVRDNITVTHNHAGTCQYCNNAVASVMELADTYAHAIAAAQEPQPAPDAHPVGNPYPDGTPWCASCGTHHRASQPAPEATPQ